MSSYIDPDEHRVPAPQEEEEEEEEDNDNNKIKGIKEVDEETRRIYILYNINFDAKLDKEIYYDDVLSVIISVVSKVPRTCRSYYIYW